MGDEVIVDRELLKAIDADTRISILKLLYERRKTQSELAAELKISPPTVLEHIQKLERAGLVKRIEEGRKWKYYELTPKGRKLISPERKPITAIIMLAVGLLLIAYAFLVFPNAGLKENGKMLLTGAEGQDGNFGVASVVKERPAYEEKEFVRAVLGVGGLLLAFAGAMKLRRMIDWGWKAQKKKNEEDI